MVSNSPIYVLMHYGTEVVDTPNRADLSLLMATNSQQIVRHWQESCVQCFIVHGEHEHAVEVLVHEVA